MAVTIRKGLLGKQDVRFYTSASPTFTRTTSSGGSTTLTPISATHIPLIQGAASLYFTQNTVQRAVSELISRYFAIEHSTATYAGGGVVGDHVTVFGFRNANAATSIQAAASNSYLRDGVARVILRNKTTTAATPIQLPRKAIIFGQGRSTIIRASSTIQTSRLFTISGSAGATQTTLNSAATVNTKTASVSSTTGLTPNTWVFVQRNTRLELHNIRSISGNTLTMQEEFQTTLASGGTVRIVYPAELYLDNVELQSTSATQGFGIAATYLVHSVIGKNVRIIGPANAGMITKRSSYNTFEPQILHSKSSSAGMGYGIRLSDGSNKNEVGGIRAGVTKEVADGGSAANVLIGQLFRTNASASMNTGATYQYSTDPFAYIYRLRKPELSYASYGATTVVTCPATNTAPAEIYINGNVLRNYGTVLCDLSRTKTPATATVGGLDRGPATATRSYYMYGVPTLTATATRQWDLMASAQSQATGLTASATFPSWSFLGAVTTGATVAIQKFAQLGDDFNVWGTSFNLVNQASPAGAQATWRAIRAAMIPIGSKAINVQIEADWNALAVDAAFNGVDVQVSHGDAVNANHIWAQIDMTRAQDAASGAQTRPEVFHLVTGLPVNSNRFFAFRCPTAGTFNYQIRFRGFTIDRGAVK